MLKYINVWQKLLLIEVLLIVFGIGFFPQPWQHVVYPILLGLLYFTSVFNLEHKYKKNMVWIASVLFAVEVITSLMELNLLDSILKVCVFGFFVFVVLNLIHQVSAAKNVTEDVIIDSISGYLLLGIMYSMLITLVIHVNPMAFNIDTSKHAQDQDIIYFVFVTLSTLGIGDVVPMTSYAKSLTILISVSGQLYMAVIITLLVGKYTSRVKNSDHPIS